MAKRKTLTILSGATDSESLSVYDPRSRVPGWLMIVAPATLPETVNVVVTGATNSGVLQSGGSDIALAAGKATQITMLGSYTIKLTATGAVAANRVFDVEGDLQ